MNDKEKLEQYVDLCEKIQDTLEGNNMEVIVPALAFFLACGGKLSQMTEEELIDYSLTTFKAVYADHDIIDNPSCVFH
jgi:hypothetical protein